MLHYVKTGDARDAYVKAGYTWTDRSLAANSRRLLREMEPYIQQKVRERLKSTESAIMAINAIEHLVDGAESEVVKLNAAKELLNRAIPEDPKEVHHHHNSDKKNLSDAELLGAIQRLQEKMFVEAKDVTDVAQAGTTGTGGGAGEEAEVQSAAVLHALPLPEGTP